MPYELHWEGQTGVVNRISGTVGPSDVLGSTIEVEADARFDTLRWVVVDLVSASGIGLDEADLDSIAALCGAGAITNPRIRIGVAALRPEILAAVRHFADSQLNPYPTRCFETLEQACTWVGEPTPSGRSQVD